MVSHRGELFMHHYEAARFVLFDRYRGFKPGFALEGFALIFIRKSISAAEPRVMTA